MNNKLLITFALLAYNQERFIREALEGAFSQTYTPLEIILSDDCSTDNTFESMKEMATAYHGPHNIILNRNDQNLGIGAHINRVMEIAKGKLIVAAAGDDISLPHRVEKIYQAYKSTEGTAKSIFSNSLIIDATGKPCFLQFETPVRTESFHLEKIIINDFMITGCSNAWDREVYDVFGPLITPLTVEDKVIAFRSTLLGQIEYIHEALVMHRRHDRNVWHYRMKTDIERDIAFEKFWIFEKKAIYKNYINDMKTVEKISPDKKDEIKHYQAILYERLLDIEEHIRMINGQFIEKLGILAKNIFKKGMKFRTIRHEIGFFLLPKIYRKYIAVKNKINGLYRK